MSAPSPATSAATWAATAMSKPCGGSGGGPFGEADAIPLARIEAEAGDAGLDALLLPLETALVDIPQVRCSEAAAQRLRNGNPAEVIASEAAAYGDTAWASCQGAPVAIGTYRVGMLSPSRVFRP